MEEGFGPAQGFLCAAQFDSSVYPWFIQGTERGGNFLKDTQLCSNRLNLALSWSPAFREQPEVSQGRDNNPISTLKTVSILQGLEGRIKSQFLFEWGQ